jgi:acetyl esterase
MVANEVMPLDPQAQEYLDAARRAALPPLPAISLEEGRIRAAKALTYAGETLPQVWDIVIPGPDGALRARHYIPRAEVLLPAVLFLHGGGWVLNNLDTHDHVCRALAKLSGCAIFSVDYRLAPEHKFPAGVEDAWAALNWLAKNGADLQVDPTRLGVAGDSSGATLATVMALRTRQAKILRLGCQALIYPPTDHWSSGTKSYRENGQDYLLTRDLMIWFWEKYLPIHPPLDNPEICPLRAPNLRGMPPTLLVTAEYDPLRDEGEAYAERLQASGVPTTITRYKGMLHGFVSHFPIMDQGKTCLRQVAQFLATHLGSPTKQG